MKLLKIALLSVALAAVGDVSVASSEVCGPAWVGRLFFKDKQRGLKTTFSEDREYWFLDDGRFFAFNPFGVVHEGRWFFRGKSGRKIEARSFDENDKLFRELFKINREQTEARYKSKMKDRHAKFSRKGKGFLKFDGEFCILFTAAR